MKQKSRANTLNRYTNIVHYSSTVDFSNRFVYNIYISVGSSVRQEIYILTRFPSYYEFNYRKVKETEIKNFRYLL